LLAFETIFVYKAFLASSVTVMFSVQVCKWMWMMMMTMMIADDDIFCKLQLTDNCQVFEQSCML